MNPNGSFTLIYFDSIPELNTFHKPTISEVQGLAPCQDFISTTVIET